MSIKVILSNNKPLLFSIALGLFYFSFATWMNINKTIKYLFIYTMFFLPGFTFPVSTSYFNIGNINFLRKIFHLILSMTIYYLVSHIFLYENRIDYITILAGFLGSLFYLLNNKFVLKQQMKIKQILIIAILSAFAFFPFEIQMILSHAVQGPFTFLPFEIIRNLPYTKFIGFGLLYWTVLNGGFLNFLNKRTL
ncbi:hypothetical protein EHQ16_12520 [Leptospira kanakyensis]|uniref:Uncharacterized protein n=1 Tax=Leptospira kanakyensis TaxID=2484968 RepID=A0A6N4Q9L1_9LEPT|nr:hypothetical protein [Leptospira kanakyensis]TGK50066.1 hypothetical protein EHQ11_10100 [Leptospira kanakyensis]TGK58416.1 hypothetical protein EHQ16_12520 [Leptospira kanakyensis]TGK69204.1 hypothetical protein EHQ18_10260 [Leptospira kanakyensis]